MKKQFYITKQAYYTQLKSNQQQQSRRLTLLRTLSFLALIFTLASGYDGQSWGYPLAIMFAIGFGYLVRQHNRLKAALNLTNSYLASIEAYLARFSTKWQTLAATGDCFKHTKRPQETDLHILGKSSLYQYLCLAQTKRGQKKLAQALTPFPTNLKQTTARQAAVAELINNQQLCLDLTAQAKLLPTSHDTTALIWSLRHANKPHNNWPSRARFFLPLLSFISLILTGLGLCSYSVPLLLFSIQLTMALVYINRHQTILAPLKQLDKELTCYAQLFKIIQQQNFTSPWLKNIQQQLNTPLVAVAKLQEVALLNDYTRMRYNIFFFCLANTLLLWDFHCCAKFLRWQQQCHSYLKTWLDSWSEIEVCLSLAIVGQTRQTWIMPQFISGEPQINTQNLSSLLIAESTAVANDSTLQAEARIITGSNMSGKTTYMRTLGSSAVLAYAGGPVCATKFSLTPLYIFTSIQVNDDLAHGISTFYAELLRIKQMVEFSHKEKPMLICIDEIFKGTNSADRIIGAQEAIRHLTRPWSITIVTTHDFELCSLTSPNSVPITNFHFEEYYEADKIHFDYKLKPDRCHTTNAQYLLKMAGILTEITNVQ